MKIPFLTRLYLYFISIIVVYLSIKFSINGTLWLFNRTQIGTIARGGGGIGVIFFLSVSFIIIFSITSSLVLKFFISSAYKKYGIENSVWHTGYSGTISNDNSVNLTKNYRSTYGDATSRYVLLGYITIGLFYCLKFQSYVFSNPINWTEDRNINLAIRAIWTILSWPWNEIEPNIINIRLE